MAEIDFFVIEDEIMDLLKLFYELKCAVIPDLNYSSPSMTRLLSPIEIYLLSESPRLFFIVKEDLVESPLHLREVKTTEKNFYYVSPRMGGPSLQFYWGKKMRREDRIQLAASTLSYYPWYEDSITGEHNKPSKAFIGIYSKCTKMIRHKCRQIKPGVRTY